MGDGAKREPDRGATLDEIRAFMTQRDLKGLPGYRTYEKESQFTQEWSCPDCGGPIPCSINCPQCGRARPLENADPEQEGTMGRLRQKAGYRKP